MKPRVEPDGRRSLSVRAHAKINLTLRVTDLRADGYHGLHTIFQSIALFDTLTLTPARGAFALSCSDPSLPLDGHNLVSRAAGLLWETAGGRGTPAGVHVHLRKRIPLQGGLGGGSADAAAALVALDAFWGTSLGAPELARLARCLGADVPFFLCGGTALGLDRGDEMYPLEELPRTAVVLVFPPFGVSTPEAFRWFDVDAGAALAESTAATTAVFQQPGSRRSSGSPRRAARAGDGGFVLGGTEMTVSNDLEAPVARRHPEIAAIRRLVERSGASAAAMTGSGSTFFGLYGSLTAARRALTPLKQAGWSAVTTRTVGRREAQPSVSLVWKRFSRIN